MSQVLANLNAQGINLPALGESKTLFKQYVVSGNHVYISGQLPLGFGDLKEHVGQLGKNCDIERARKIANYCALNAIAQLQAAIGDLDKVKRCTKLTVFVNSTAEFTDQPQVANAASELMIQAFGEKGAHARSAIGVSQLPFGVAVEVEAIFEI
jgi:enamine deaminase RidA (YjgF/YER057c/UK114 family)